MRRRGWGLALVCLAACGSGATNETLDADAGTSDASTEAGDADDAGNAPETGGAARPRIVVVADTPSHGPGEHEYTAGAYMLRRLLGEMGVDVDIVSDGWPADPAIFEGARAIGFFSNGYVLHPLGVGDRLDVLERALTKGVGFFALHWATHFPEELIPRALPILGGSYSVAISNNPVWTASFTSLPDHPATRGVVPFTRMDEWYYDLAFATDRPPLPLLAAVPPEETRVSPDSAMHPGRAETTSWVYERPDGGRAFGYTGLHFHASWGEEPVRRLVTNAVLWTAGLEVPAGGAPVTFDPAWLTEHLDPK